MGEGSIDYITEIWEYYLVTDAPQLFYLFIYFQESGF